MGLRWYTVVRKNRRPVRGALFEYESAAAGREDGNMEGTGAQTVGGLILIAVAVIHLGFSAGVWADADRLKKDNQKTWFVGTFLWTLATLLGGPIIALCYWLIHRSTLRPPVRSKDELPSEP